MKKKMKTKKKKRNRSYASNGPVWNHVGLRGVENVGCRKMILHPFFMLFTRMT